MKTLKMNPDMLDIHLSAWINAFDEPKLIFTTRDEVKGEVGEVFRIEGLENKFKLRFVREYSSVEEYRKFFAQRFYFLTGFNSEFELMNAVNAFYPNASKLCIHEFEECYD